MTQDYQALAQAGIAAWRAGDAAGARDRLAEVAAAGRASPQLWLVLAQAAIKLGDTAGALMAVDKVIAAEPANLYALLMRADLTAHGGDERAAVSWYEAALRQAPRAGQLAPDLVEALRRAEAAVGRSAGAFRRHLDAALAGIDRTEAGPRFAQALDILAGAEVYLQQPTNFYFPGLAATPFFDPGIFPWLARMTLAAPAILAELEALMAAGDATHPYVVAEPNRPAKRHALMGDRRWSAAHLYQAGEPVAENAARCPATMAALAHAPMPVIPGRSPMALFSVLEPGTHIPPHNGMLNTRLICHLPLVVPDGCRLRVGHETRRVERFVPLVFDDSIEHEAWNDGDATRVVLLFEVWRPDLSAGEREALTALYGAIPAYGQ